MGRTGRRTWYPLSSSFIIAIAIICASDAIGTICCALPAVKDGPKLIELSSAASSISIWDIACCGYPESLDL